MAKKKSKQNKLVKDILVFLLIAALAVASLLIARYFYNKNKAKENAELATYTITWVNEDGSVLEVDKDVNQGDMPVYNGAIPTKASDETYKYIFDKWTPNITAAVADATYKATFKAKDINATTDDLAIHFIAGDNDKAGDCIYIKAGQTDILVDAGSRASSAGAIKTYLDNYVTDGKLEFVIATHADQDHIAGFVGTNEFPGIFEVYECETIIDFPLTDKTTKTYQNYCTKRDAEVASGAKHYNALQCYNNEGEAKRKYDIAEGIELEILYNYFYENKSNDENNYSVCFLINQDEHHYLFTGDLEKKGEEYLVEYNTLPEVDLFKAGHHGSPTSSNDCLLSVIKPKICVVCCCAGTDEYTLVKDNQFPSQAFISRICKYTEKVYVTNQVSDNEAGFTAMNGNVIVSCDGTEVSVICSASSTILKETAWFIANRKWE